MPVPKRYLNAEIIEIVRVTESDYGGPGTETVVIAGPIPCNRQTKIERNFGTQLTRFTSEGPSEFVDAAFYIDLRDDATSIRVGDRIKWRRVRDAAGNPITGPEITGTEIRRIDVNDGIIGARRRNIRFLTRGGDGSGV